MRRIKRQEEFKIPLCKSSGGNLRRSYQTSTRELLCVSRQRPKHVDCFRKKSTTHVPSDFKCASDHWCCEWVECNCMEFVAVGWCRRKWLRLYQTIRNLTSGDMVIHLWWFNREYRIEKDQAHVSPRPVWGKRERGQCDLVCVCGALLDDWGNVGYVNVLITCGECGFSSFGFKIPWYMLELKLSKNWPRENWGIEVLRASVFLNSNFQLSDIPLLINQFISLIELKTIY